MTRAIDLQDRRSPKIKQFRELIFIGNCSTKSKIESLEQLHLTPNNNLLSQANLGDSLLIIQMHTARSITHQLKNLQIEPGVVVEVVSKSDRGSVIISLDRQLIGIGAEPARKIVVTSTNQTR
ncbi:MAG: FeoA family protein [Pleurocapsa sp. MO_226.B13]|nr:FeoA family protein [Pleurocapsa sp. MO_226.B13]